MVNRNQKTLNSHQILVLNVESEHGVFGFKVVWVLAADDVNIVVERREAVILDFIW